MRFRRLLPVLLLVLALPAIPADERTDPLDIYILLDKSVSMSMDKKFSEARAWLLADIVEKVIRPGDRLYLTAFFGKTTNVWDGPIASETDRKELIGRLRTLKPNGRWTDIPSALDSLTKALEAASTDGRKKYVLLITDDEQEAPPTSPYYSPDGSYKHNYLTYVRIEEHGNWKAITLGIGIDAKVTSSVALLKDGILSELPGQEEGMPGGTAEKGSFERIVGDAFPWVLLVFLLLVLLLLALLVAKRLQSNKKKREAGEKDADSGRG